MSLTWPEKPERESLELEAFLKTYKALPHGRPLKLLDSDRERPDCELEDLETGEHLGLELTSVYRSDRSVSDEHLSRELNDPDFDDQPPSEAPNLAEIEQLLKRMAEAVKAKVRKAQAYECFPRMILAIYHNDLYSIHLHDPTEPGRFWRKFARQHAAVFDALRPFDEVVLVNLPNALPISILSSREVRVGVSQENLKLGTHLIASRHSGLELLVLYGSRSREDYRPDSDWDFAYLADDRFDPAALLADLVILLNTDAIGLVNLSGAGGLLRYRVAREGQPLYEARDEAFDQFRWEALFFWYDAQKVLEEGYEEILARLPG